MSETATMAPSPEQGDDTRGETLPAGYQPSVAEEFMNPRQLAYFRSKLLRWKDDILNLKNLRSLCPL